MMIDQEKIDAYKIKQPLTFSEALEMLKFDLKVKRMSWGLPQLDFIKIKKPTGANDGSRRDAYFVDYFGNEMAITTLDILSDDWIIVE